jgi:hypothetical protein
MPVRHLLPHLMLMAACLGCAPAPEAPLPPDTMEAPPGSTTDIPDARPDILFMDEQEEAAEDEGDGLP